MVNLTVSQATRRDAHNLDDLHERWENRITVYDPVLDFRALEMPNFNSYDELCDFQAALAANHDTVQQLLKDIKQDDYGRNLTLTAKYKARRQHLVTELEKIKAIKIDLKLIVKGARLAKQQKTKPVTNDDRKQQKLDRVCAYHSLACAYIQDGFAKMQIAYDEMPSDRKQLIVKESLMKMLGVDELDFVFDVTIVEEQTNG